MTFVRGVGVLLLALVLSSCAPAPALSTLPTILIHFSRFEPDTLRVPVGVPITFTLESEDPITHEWIVGPPELHQIHRTGTDPVHEGRPNEVTVPAYLTRTTTITFDQPGEYAYICHLPGHEGYGMKGKLTVVPTTRA
jgi:plastocyanin